MKRQNAHVYVFDVNFPGVAADGATTGADTATRGTATQDWANAGFMLQGWRGGTSGTASAADGRHRASAEDIWWPWIQATWGLVNHCLLSIISLKADIMSVLGFNKCRSLRKAAPFFFYTLSWVGTLYKICGNVVCRQCLKLAIKMARYAGLTACENCQPCQRPSCPEFLFSENSNTSGRASLQRNLFARGKNFIGRAVISSTGVCRNNPCS